MATRLKYDWPTELPSLTKLKGQLTMNTSNIDKVLDLPAIDDSFEKINWGGCGFMVKIIAEQLDLLNINYDIACKGGWACPDKMTNEQVNDCITTNNIRDIPNSHVMIMINGRLFDSEGEQFFGESRITALIDHDTITRMLDVDDAWNHTFDRDQVNGMRAYTESMFHNVFGEVA